MAQNVFDIIIIGAGPGGYVAAIKAAQMGLKTLCVDKRTTLGGTCLNVGCIPSKALLYSSEKYSSLSHLKHHGITFEGVDFDLSAMLARKDKVVSDLTKGIDYLFKKNGVHFVSGMASFTSPTTIQVNQEIYEAPAIVIATGSDVVTLPGIDIDETTIVSSTGALSLPKVPQELVVIGGGYIGLELGSVWNRLGAHVTVVEYADRIVPGLDHDMSQALFKALTQQGIQFELSTKVTGVNKQDQGVEITLESHVTKTHVTKTLRADVLLCCAGRKPMTHGLGLDKVNITPNARGYIPVDMFQTCVPSIYAIGDVIEGPMLAHKAEEEGVAVIERIMGQKPHINPRAIPAVIYTMPEVACVGLTESQLKEEGKAIKVGKFPFSANSRAKATGHTEGFVKILADAMTDEVYGVHIIHASAGTMIAEAVLAMEYRASSEDIARTCHAHPTLNEAVKEAALSVFSHALHT